MREERMPRGDKAKYTGKQERKADHIAESYEKRGVPEKEAERRAWATVNKDDGGGKEPGGSGRGKSTGHPAAHRGGKIGGAHSAARPASARSAAAEKAAATRERNAGELGPRPPPPPAEADGLGYRLSHQPHHVLHAVHDRHCDRARLFGAGG